MAARSRPLDVLVLSIHLTALPMRPTMASHLRFLDQSRERHRIVYLKRRRPLPAAACERLGDTALVQRLAERAHRDLVASGEYTYAAFARLFEDAVADFVPEHPGRVARPRGPPAG